MTPPSLVGCLEEDLSASCPTASQEGCAVSATGEFAPSSSEREDTKIAALLKQFENGRPMRVPFVPIDGHVDGKGRPYLHGSLEVGLFLSEDNSRVQVRIGTSVGGGSGRIMELEEFVARAEAIEARRGHRPNTISEETEVHH